MTNLPPAGVSARGWVYDSPGRDLRVDFIRGMVMFVLVVVHIEFFSLFNFIAWERIGVVSGGEGFVILAGFVVGMVYRHRGEAKGWKDAVGKMVDRALQLYRVNVAVIVTVALLSLLPGLDTSSITTFNDRGAGQVYSLYPKADAPIQTWLGMILFLKVGPHQIQILGLYVFLLALAPGVLWLMLHGRTRLVLALSWLAYAYQWAWPAMPTGAQFEYAFPLLAWQLIFVHGMAAGAHRDRLIEFAKGPWGRKVLVASTTLCLLFLFFAQNNPNPTVPSWARMSVIPAGAFNELYGRYFVKNSTGILRVLNYAAILVVGYTLLTRFWKPVHRAFGWFFIPLGQASLYVFIVHVFVVMLVANVLPFGFPLDHHDLWANTLAHAAAFALLWTMVRYQVLYRWIPR